jgi:hypothetical protein
MELVTSLPELAIVTLTCQIVPANPDYNRYLQTAWPIGDKPSPRTLRYLQTVWPIGDKPSPRILFHSEVQAHLLAYLKAHQLLFVLFRTALKAELFSLAIHSIACAASVRNALLSAN